MTGAARRRRALRRGALAVWCVALGDGLGAQPAAVRVIEAWARPCAAGGTCGAYVSLENPGATAVDVVALASPAAARAELHLTTLHGGQARMRRAARVAIPARARLAMRPGGWHLMLPRARRAFAPGDTIPITIELAPAHGTAAAPRRTLAVHAVVRAP